MWVGRRWRTASLPAEMIVLTVQGGGRQLSSTVGFIPCYPLNTLSQDSGTQAPWTVDTASRVAVIHRSGFISINTNMKPFNITGIKTTTFP